MPGYLAIEAIEQTLRDNDALSIIRPAAPEGNLPLGRLSFGELLKRIEMLRLRRRQRVFTKQPCDPSCLTPPTVSLEQSLSGTSRCLYCLASDY